MGGSTAIETVGQILFDAAENAIIESFFGWAAASAPTDTDTTTETSRHAIDAATRANLAVREGGNDNEDRRRRKNDKGCKKNEHKGKQQSKALHRPCKMATFPMISLAGFRQYRRATVESLPAIT